MQNTEVTSLWSTLLSWLLTDLPFNFRALMNWWRRLSQPASVWKDPWKWKTLSVSVWEGSLDAASSGLFAFYGFWKSSSGLGLLRTGNEYVTEIKQRRVHQGAGEGGMFSVLNRQFCTLGWSRCNVFWSFSTRCQQTSLGEGSAQTLVGDAPLLRHSTRATSTVLWSLGLGGVSTSLQIRIETQKGKRNYLQSCN